MSFVDPEKRLTVDLRLYAIVDPETAGGHALPDLARMVAAGGATVVQLRDKVHDGQGMGGTSYRVAVKPMLPGSKADEANFKDLESMPVRSIVTRPANGTRLGASVRELSLRGAAWAGDSTVSKVLPFYGPQELIRSSLDRTGAVLAPLLLTTAYGLVMMVIARVFLSRRLEVTHHARTA